MVHLRLLLVAVALPLAAQAAEIPRRFPHEGRLLRADGTPESGPVVLTFRLYDAPIAGVELWSEQQLIQLSAGGYYAADLGKSNALPAGIFDGRSLWLGVSVGGEPEMTPRVAVGTVPYALRAEVAARAESLSDGGTGHSHTWDSITGKPAVFPPASHAHDWDSIAQKPAAFPPQAHTHPVSQIEGNVVTGVLAAAPLFSTGGATPTLSLQQAGLSASGYLSAADWSLFSAKVGTPGGDNLVDWVARTEWLPAGTAWSRISGVGTVALETNDTLEGDVAYDFTAAAGTSGGVWTYGDLIPVDPRRAYIGRVSVKLISGAGTFYAGYAAYDAARSLLSGNGGTYGYFLANGASLPTGAWTEFSGVIQGEGTQIHQFPMGTRFIRPLVITNYQNVGTTRVGAFSLAPSAARVHRSQGTTGAVSCSSARDLPGSITFAAHAGEWATLSFSYTGRSNTCGHAYADLYLNNVHVHVGSTGTDERGCSWRRTLGMTINRQITTTGNYTFRVVFSCGSGMSSFTDESAEWPLGGVSHTVIVGG